VPQKEVNMVQSTSVSERENWVEQMRNRVPSEGDLATIQDLHSKGWKAPAIASGIEMNVKAVRKAIRKLV
jgi:hypothetical protein